MSASRNFEFGTVAARPYDRALIGRGRHLLQEKVQRVPSARILVEIIDHHDHRLPTKILPRLRGQTRAESVALVGDDHHSVWNLAAQHLKDSSGFARRRGSDEKHILIFPD